MCSLSHALSNTLTISAHINATHAVRALSPTHICTFGVHSTDARCLLLQPTNFCFNEMLPMNASQRLQSERNSHISTA